MWVLDDMPVFRRPKLVTPHMVAEIGSPDDGSLGEVDEVAIQRRAIETFLSECIEELWMAHGRARPLEKAQNGNSRPCRPQARFAEHLS